MKTIKINKSELIDVIEKALREMNGFSWTGWGIPIFITHEGEVSAGSIISNNSYCPESIELIRIETWQTENQNSITAWKHDEMDEKYKEMIEAFEKKHDIDITDFSFEALIEMGLPTELQEDYENYQETEIDYAIDEDKESYIERIEQGNDYPEQNIIIELCE